MTTARRKSPKVKSSDDSAERVWVRFPSGRERIVTNRYYFSGRVSDETDIIMSLPPRNQLH